MENLTPPRKTAHAVLIKIIFNISTCTKFIIKLIHIVISYCMW